MSSSEVEPLDLLDFDTHLAAAGSGLSDWAASGGMWLTGSSSEPPRTCGAGAAAVATTSLARIADLTLARTGRTPPLPTAALLGERAAVAGLDRNAPWSPGGSTRAIRGADRWWMLVLARDSDHAALEALTRAPVTGDEIADVDRWAATTTAAEAVARAQLLGLAASVVPDGSDDPDEQRSHRGTAATRLIRGGSRRTSSRPLIVDLTALWAGPLCASLLSAGGCEVIKVESTRRLDGARFGLPEFFDLLHAGHRSVTLDLACARGRDQLRTLIADADVVLEASRPRALAQLGIDAAEVVARGTIWVSITAYGRTGPWANRVGFGDDAAVAGGLHTLVAGVPSPIGDAIADPLTGAYAAAVTSAALLAPDAFLLDIAMREVAAIAARIPVPSSEVHGSDQEGWSVVWDEGHARVAPPAHRPGRNRYGPPHATAPGADNGTLLRSTVRG